MPSAYLLAKDHIEQARAILSSEVWHDDEASHLLDCLADRLVELDSRLLDARPIEHPMAFEGMLARRLPPVR